MAFVANRAFWLGVVSISFACAKIAKLNAALTIFFTIKYSKTYETWHTQKKTSTANEQAWERDWERQKMTEKAEKRESKSVCVPVRELERVRGRVLTPCKGVREWERNSEVASGNKRGGTGMIKKWGRTGGERKWQSHVEEFTFLGSIRDTTSWAINHIHAVMRFSWIKESSWNKMMINK